MAFNLKNRSFVKELDFTPKEMKFLLDLKRESGELGNDEVLRRLDEWWERRNR